MTYAYRFQTLLMLSLCWLGLAGMACAAEGGVARADESAAGMTVEGNIVFLSGRVSVERHGQSVTPVMGDRIRVGDRIQTGSDGYLHVRFNDGGLISVRPDSSAFIESYYFDPASPADSRVRIDLQRGVLRSVTGQAGESAPDQFRVNTPVAAIGIRGTDFVIYSDDEMSRLAVRAGGVVMAPFSETCVAASFNPCGDGAAELFASFDSPSLLEVRAGDLAALITTDAPDPDELIPPHPQESTLFNNLSRDDRTTRANEAPPGAAPASSYEEGLERIARFIDEDELMQLANLIASQRDPAILERDRRLVSNPRFVWGRWDSGAGNVPSFSTALFDGSRQVRRRAANNRFFQLAIADEGIRLPKGGQAVFELNAYEAYVVRGDQFEVAGISNAALVVDFDRSRFATRMDIHADSLSGPEPIVGTGNINVRGVDGYFESDKHSISGINGMLSDNAREAGLLFERPLSDGSYAAGATHWVNSGKRGP